MKKRYTGFKALFIGFVCAAVTAASALPAMADGVVSPLTGTSSGIENVAPGGGAAGGNGAAAGAAASGAENTAPGAPNLPASTLWIVGDSTAASFQDSSYYSPRYGWGTQLGTYFQGIEIRNLAVSGTSSKSFVDTDQYKSLLSGIKSGDYLMIAFGHNDERAESGRYTDPNGSYNASGSFQHYLYEKYIKVAMDHGATPVLCTPVVRRDLGNNYTGESGHITSPQTNSDGTFAGGNYAKAIWQIGVAKSVPVLDLTARTRDVYEQLGAQGVKNRHAMTSNREASIDNTHTNLYGAQCNAWFVADELAKSSSPLKDYLVPERPVPQYSDAAINPSYQPQAFNAPTDVSSFWSATGSWRGTVFGDIDGYEYLNNRYFTLQPGNDSSIRMAAGLGTEAGQFVGKISPERDGIAMYYQVIPADRNFILSADVTINQLDSNIQSSFGLMVRDDIYLDTVINDTMGDYVAAAPLMLGSSDPWNCFARKNGALVQGAPLTKPYSPGQTVHVEIRKSSDGYTCIFGDNAAVSSGFDFPLTAIDSSNVYAGMFVSRSADVTFHNVSLTLQ